MERKMDQRECKEGRKIKKERGKQKAKRSDGKEDL